MATYRYTTLTEDVQHNIKAAVYSKQELDEIYGGLREKADAGRKKMKTVRIIIAAIYVLAVLPAIKSVADMGDSGFGWVILSALLPLPFFALGYALARWHTYGMFCSQFNKAVRKGYPELAEEYKL